MMHFIDCHSQSWPLYFQKYFYLEHIKHIDKVSLPTEYRLLWLCLSFRIHGGDSYFYIEYLNKLRLKAKNTTFK